MSRSTARILTTTSATVLRDSHTLLKPAETVPSVLHHNSSWKPWQIGRQTREARASSWSRFFHIAFERLTPTDDTFAVAGAEPATAPRADAPALTHSSGISRTCMWEAPERATRRRRRQTPRQAA